MDNNGKIRISLYTRNSEKGPSDYYRVVQYMHQIDAISIIHDALPTNLFDHNLKNNGEIVSRIIQPVLYVYICIRRLCSLLYDIRHTPDVVIIQREVCPRYIPIMLAFLLKILLDRSLLIWDFDDDIINLGEISQREAKILEKKSSRIVVINTYLKETIDNEYRQKVILLPTTDSTLTDEQLIHANIIRCASYNNEIRLLWIGTAHSVKRIDLILDKLDVAAERVRNKGKKLLLEIVSNSVYKRSTVYLKIENTEWSRSAVNDALMRSHIGIMPLENNRVAEGKGGFKLIQYMSAGLPVIGSRVGFNKEIVDTDIGLLVDNDDQGWTDAICRLSLDRIYWSKCGSNSNKVYKEKFDRNMVLSVWAKLIKESV